jgi:prepilin-type processing-associated H-X9-DG protein
VKYASATLRITESVFEANGEGSWQAVTPEATPGAAPLLAPGWHNDKNCVLWVDGHVTVMFARPPRCYAIDGVMYDGRYDDNPSEVQVRDKYDLTRNVWCRLNGPKEGRQVGD